MKDTFRLTGIGGVILFLMIAFAVSTILVTPVCARGEVVQTGLDEGTNDGERSIPHDVRSSYDGDGYGRCR
ncbi:MAG: hypothetical protein ACE5FA_01050 [Dehalococcoidia bacterium]